MRTFLLVLAVAAALTVPATAQDVGRMKEANDAYYRRRAGLPVPPPVASVPTPETRVRTVQFDRGAVLPPPPGPEDIAAEARRRFGEEVTPGPSAPRPGWPPPTPKSPGEVAAEARQQVGEASRRYESERGQMEDSYRRLVESFARGQPGDRFERDLREAARNRELLRFVTYLRQVGDVVTRDEAAFRAAVRRFQGVSADAAPKFERASGQFRKLADAAEFDEARKLYRKTAEWYAARAEKARREAAVKVPTDYDTERRRFLAYLKAITDLEEQLKADESLFQDDAEGIELLAAFNGYYGKLNGVLQKFTDEIVKTMPKDESKGPARAF